jgi:hypothetical protein
VLPGLLCLLCGCGGLLSTPDGELASPVNVHWPESVGAAELRAIGIQPDDDTVLEETAYGAELAAGTLFLSSPRWWTWLSGGYYVYPLNEEQGDFSGELESWPVAVTARISLLQFRGSQLWLEFGGDYRFNRTTRAEGVRNFDDSWGGRGALGLTLPDTLGHTLTLAVGYQYGRADVDLQGSSEDEVVFDGLNAWLGWTF